jgi:hypothetical protein
MVPVPLIGPSLNEGEMKTNWKHQKDAITTDQKFRNEDEHLHELDKRHLKESEKKDPALIAKKQGATSPKEDDGD